MGSYGVWVKDGTVPNHGLVRSDDRLFTRERANVHLLVHEIREGAI